MREEELLYATRGQRVKPEGPPPRGWGNRHPEPAPLQGRPEFVTCPGAGGRSCGVRIDQSMTSRILCRYCTWSLVAR